MPNQEQVKELIEVLMGSGYTPKSYSGRGMYGKCCVSISEDGVTAWEIAKNLWYDVDTYMHVDVPEPRQDQLGLGIVLYWPSYEWPQEKV
jgi:hypothetical protein